MAVRWTKDCPYATKCYGQCPGAYIASRFAPRGQVFEHLASPFFRVSSRFPRQPFSLLGVLPSGNPASASGERSARLDFLYLKSKKPRQDRSIGYSYLMFIQSGDDICV
jgi:hypothetical protein